MRDTDLYGQILGIKSPWFVDNVELKIAEGQVDIHLAHQPGVLWACPECGKELTCRDHAEERTWRHLDTCQLKTFLHARIPRVACPEHGVAQVSIPWAEPRGRFTLLMERLIIDVIKECSTVTGACRLLDLSWDEAFGVMQRSVRRGLSRKQSRKVSYIGVDEKAFKKGHNYMTVVCDLMRGTVEHVAEERKAESLEEYYRTLSADQLSAIKAVAMDMWPAYFQATRKWVPEAMRKIVFDRFHIMRHVLEAVNTVRKREHRGLLEHGDTTLARSKYLWLYSAENVPQRAREHFDRLKGLQLKTARAWALKESLRELWDCHSLGWARQFWKRWYFWATHSRLGPMIAAAKLIARHLPNVLTYFAHRITNAVAEGLNSKIATVQKRACGFRNRDHFKIAVYFHCGGLNLYPTSATHRKAG